MSEPQQQQEQQKITTVAQIAVIGAGWWSQGWHLPHLSRHPNVHLAAIVDTCPHPTSPLNPHLLSLSQLSQRYQNVPTFLSLEELLDSSVGAQLDGVLVATPHATHYAVCVQLLEYAQRRPQPHKPLHILLEKPATTDVHQAYQLHQLYTETCKQQQQNKIGCLLLNHTANYRIQTQRAAAALAHTSFGPIRHIDASMECPLSNLFDNPQLTGWNAPTGTMLGNGFGWGQISHLLGWIFGVCPSTLVPHRVFCTMIHSSHTGADVALSATILCRDTSSSSTTTAPPDTIVNVSGTSLLPGFEHGATKVGKRLSIHVFGDGQCALSYSGNDAQPTSGRLELLRSSNNHTQILSDTFAFEDCSDQGTGPESLQCFVRACRGDSIVDNDDDSYPGADTRIGLWTVAVIDAMYRSHASKQLEKVLYCSDLAS